MPEPNTPSFEAVPLQAYMEALFADQRLAIDLAERVRDQAAEVLRGEQHRASDTADAERLRSAQVLAAQLQQSIKEGDDRLREHVANQIEQVRAALESAEKLEVERMAKVMDFIASVQREVQITAEASDKAIQKAETANEKRFDGVNDLRGTMADQASAYMPREVAEAQINELRSQISRAAEQLGKLA